MEEIRGPLQSSILNPLQPYILPITTALPQPVNNALVSILGEQCFDSLILSLDVAKNPDCLSLAVSKALGIAIVSASAIVKVPQIIKLLSSRSSAGVSFTSYALETTSFLITFAYNARQGFPFSTYGESALIAVQDIVVSILVLAFSNQAATAGAFLAGVAGILYALLFSGQTLVDDATIGYLQAGSGALSVVSKVPQIYTIWKQGGTGQLSAFAVGFRLICSIIVNIFYPLVICCLFIKPRNLSKEMLTDSYLGSQLHVWIAFQDLHDSTRSR